MMRTGATSRVTVLFLIPLLVAASASGARAQSPPTELTNALREAAATDSHPAWGKQLHAVRHRAPCNPKKRLLAGAAIGALIGMVAVRGAASANDGTIGFKDAVKAGAYGGALGALIGLKTCR